MIEEENKSIPFSEFEKSVKLSDKEIFSLIWSSPKKTFKYIVKNHYDKHLILLLFLAGVVKTFDRASQKNMGDSMDLWSVIGICIFAGGFFGWVSMYFYATLMNWTGKWLGTQGDNTKSILLIYSYAMIPSILSLIMIFFQILIVGDSIFKSNGYPELDTFNTILFYGSFIAELILSAWTIFLFVIGTSIVQKLPIGKSILNLILPIFVIIVPIIFIVLVLYK